MNMGSIMISYCHHIFFALVIVLQMTSCCHQVEGYGAKVEMLPGFEGPLPFQLETGYVGLGETDDDMQVFYYFIKSENNPKEDPLMLWLSGGPGCSPFSGLAYEIGPFQFKIEEYNGSLPNLISRPQSWTKVSSIIFADLPFGTGFSYAKELSAYRNDWKLIQHTHQFLRKWLIGHSEFISNKFYIGADSYAGIHGPAITQEILDGNEKGLQPWINFQGYLLGNPVTTKKEKNYQIPFAHGMGLISDELYSSLQKNCKGEYLEDDFGVDSRNKLCLKDMEYYDECLSGINKFQISDANCEHDWDEGHDEVRYRKSLTQQLKNPLSSHLTNILSDISCMCYYSFHLGTQWINDESVREALHVRKGTIGKWKRCYLDDFDSHQISSSFEFHVNLSAKGYRSLIYSGDHDLVVPFMATQAWIRALNYSIVDDWRPWLVNDQVAGYTRSYDNQMTFATVKGAGHTAPTFKPDESLAMFTRWLSNAPL